MYLTEGGSIGVESDLKVEHRIGTAYPDDFIEKLLEWAGRHKLEDIETDHEVHGAVG